MGDRILMQLAGKVRNLSFAGGPPTVSSADCGWAGVPLEQHRMQSVESVGESGPLDVHAGLLIVTEGQIDIVLREGRRDVVHRARAGTVSYLNGQCRPHVVRMQGNAQAIALQLTKPWFERVLLEDAPLNFGRGQHFIDDPTILGLSCAMRDEVERGATTGRLYAESLSTALLTYALERVPPSRVKVRGTLPDEQQRRLRNYIRDNLGEDLSLLQLAALVGRSPRHFSSLFKQSFGVTPHQYLLQVRLNEGARRLEQGGADIAQIALELGFCSQSHFAHLFRRKFSRTPREHAMQRRLTTSS